jgi:enoyl-CoA hydratase
VTETENSHARTEEVDGVITVTFTRDDKRNAISGEMFDAIDSALVTLDDRDDLRVMVIRSEGRFFSAGIDIGLMRADLGHGTDGLFHGSNMRRDYRNDARHDLFDRMETVEKPIIVAIHGPCLGIGIEFGSSCDFRLASDAATFALPEIANLAIIPGAGGISRLTRLVGPHWAKWLVMMGETISAQQALDIGFVHAVYPADEFDEAVDAAARKLASMPREALDVAKMAIDAAPLADRRAARDFDRVAQTYLISSPEHRERVDRFMNR